MKKLNDILKVLAPSVPSGVCKANRHAWTFDEEVDPDNYICEECAESTPVKEFDWDLERKGRDELCEK